MRDETKFYVKTVQEGEMPVSHSESATSGNVAAKETQQILKDNQDVKKALSAQLEATGLSKEAAARLLHLEIER